MGAAEAKPGPNPGNGGRQRPRGRLRLAALPDASAASLEGFIAADTAGPLSVTTDGRAAHCRLDAEGQLHETIDLSASCGDASLRLPANQLVFSLAKRRLLGTHHGAVRPEHLQRYLEEFVFRFNRREAKTMSHGFADLILHAVKTPPTTDRGIVQGMAAGGLRIGSSIK